MHVLTVYAHPNPKSFCHAVLDQFVAGLRDAGHTNEVVDLYAIGFDPRWASATTRTGWMRRSPTTSSIACVCERRSSKRRVDRCSASP